MDLCCLDVVVGVGVIAVDTITIMKTAVVNDEIQWLLAVGCWLLPNGDNMSSVLTTADSWHCYFIAPDRSPMRWPMAHSICVELRWPDVVEFEVRRDFGKNVV